MPIMPISKIKVDTAEHELHAYQLTTARTIALSGDVSGSTTFDGSKDVTITTAVTNNFLRRPNDLPTETSLVTVSSTGTHAYKKVSELVDTTSEQTLTGKKTWGTKNSSFYTIAEISKNGVSVESGGNNPNVQVSPEAYNNLLFSAYSITQTIKNAGVASEYSSSFIFPTYNNQGGNYYFSMTPDAAPTEPSVVVNAADRTPTWKPLSEFGGGDSNIINGTGTGSLVQKTVSSSGTPYANEASGSGAVAMGKKVKSKGNTTFVIGQENEAITDTSASFTSGRLNVNRGSYNITGGENNANNNSWNLVIGKNNSVSDGRFGIVSGLDNVFTGLGSDENSAVSILGKNLYVQYSMPSDGALLIGRYNEVQNNPGRLFIVGNGTSKDDRKNAFEVLEDGRAKIQTTPQDADDVANKGYVDGRVSVPTQSQVDLLF